MNSSDLLKAVLALSEAIERDGGLRSALRRAETTLDVLGIEAVDSFVNKLAKMDSRNPERFEAAVILLAHRNVLPYREAVKQAAPVPVSHVLAGRLGEKSGERRRFSELRFQRLLRAADDADRLKQMRRALALLEVPVHPLHVVRAWLDLFNDQGRRAFARAYFNGIATPIEAPSALIAGAN